MFNIYVEIKMKMIEEATEFDAATLDELQLYTEARRCNSMPEKLAFNLIKGVGDINDKSPEASDIINDYYSE